MKRLPFIAPLKAGLVLGVFYAFISLVVVPFFILAFVFGAKTGGSGPAFLGLGFIIFMPVIYGALGFIGGIIAAALYNLIAKWTGGFEFRLEDASLS